MVLRLKNSRIEFALSLLLHGVALCSLVFIDLHPVVQFFMGLIILLLFIGEWRGSLPKGIEQIRYNGIGWELLNAGQLIEVGAPQVLFFSEFLITVDFKTSTSGSFRLMIFPDSMEQADFLRFRKYLRFDNLSHL